MYKSFRDEVTQFNDKFKKLCVYVFFNFMKLFESAFKSYEAYFSFFKLCLYKTNYLCDNLQNVYDK